MIIKSYDLQGPKSVSRKGRGAEGRGLEAAQDSQQRGQMGVGEWFCPLPIRDPRPLGPGVLPGWKRSSQC